MAHSSNSTRRTRQIPLQPHDEDSDAGAGQRWVQHSFPESELPEGAVHIWRIGLNVSDLALRGFRGMLREEELGRAERFRFPVLGRRFVAGRGALRAILAGYLSTEPQELTFSYNVHGKPSLLDCPGNIQFNVSHSHDLMVAAFCREWAIGVDIEKEDPRLHAMDIAQRFFCKRERDEIAQKGKEEGLRTFFQLWTAKEAVLKAASLGLTLELANLEIGLRPLRILALQDCRRLRDAIWHLTAFSPANGYSGALAVAAEPARLEYRDFVLGENFE
jgi:4'-phosphopantetheinyl transferase